MINGQNNKKKKVQTGITQGLRILSILFQLYISKVFEKVGLELPKVLLLLFVNDLGFIISKVSVNKIIQIFEEVGKIILK